MDVASTLSTLSPPATPTYVGYGPGTGTWFSPKSFGIACNQSGGCATGEPINLGNGNDVTVVNGSVGGLVIYHAGNGNDSLQLGNGSASTNYNGNVVFGNGADTLTLATGGSVRGTFIGGTNLANVFNQSGGSVTATLSPFFTLINFP